MYDDNLLALPGDRYMTLVNQVDMDKYLAGVVEAEAGSNAEKEFYKAQSVLCRTYALKQMERHSSEGFSLCDGTHCQAYKGKSTTNPEILEAIVETSAMVLADYNFKEEAEMAYVSNLNGKYNDEKWIMQIDDHSAIVDNMHENQ